MSEVSGSDTYSQDEVEEILRRALAGAEVGDDAAGQRKDGLKREELLQAAAEAGIGRSSVERAISELETQRRRTSLEQRVRRSWRHQLRQRALSLGIVNIFLAAIDWLTGAGWWVQWPLVGSAFVLAWDARRSYFPSEENLERATKRLARLEERTRRKRLEQRAGGDRKQAQHQFELAVQQGVTTLLTAMAKRAESMTKRQEDDRK